jgi:hypothetical protein
MGFLGLVCFGKPYFTRKALLFSPFLAMVLVKNFSLLILLLSSQAVQSDPSRLSIDLTVNYLIHAEIGAIVWWPELTRHARPNKWQFGYISLVPPALVSR